MLGCIADDFTGATDLGSMLREGGMRVIQCLGIPDAFPDESVDAFIIALKSRSVPAKEAVEESLKALEWLKKAGCQQFYFKYCSTFDSTDEGNIGPVTEALMSALGVSFTIACPAYPENGRTIFNGYLFVGQQLLSESSMRHHPLNPMTDSNLVAVLQRQTDLKVGLLNYQNLRSEKREEYVTDLINSGVNIAITDVTTDDDLIELIKEFGHLKLLTGGSGLALGLPKVLQKSHDLNSNVDEFKTGSITGHAAVISGSCSEMTLKQVKKMEETNFSFQLKYEHLENEASLENLIQEVQVQLGSKPILVYSSNKPLEVKHMQATLGTDAGEKIERALAHIAKRFVESGVTKLVVAGGETSGAVLKALDIKRLRIGSVIEPGVPWTQSTDNPELFLALKSGNFGKEDFFIKAFDLLEK